MQYHEKNTTFVFCIDATLFPIVLPQRILTLGAFGIFKHLTQRRLPNVEIGPFLQMPRGDFRIGVQCRDAHD